MDLLLGPLFSLLGWNVMSKAERKMYVSIATCFFLVVGGYWLVRPLKIGVFVQQVGLEYEPMAKLGTVAILIPLLFVYNLFYEIYPLKRMMTAILAMYAAAFLCISFFLSFTDQDTLKPDKWNVLGWFTYWAIETFGSVVVSMFWSATATLAKPEHAPIFYPVVVVVSQIGAVGGATLAINTEHFSFHFMFFLQVLNLCILAGLVAFLFKQKSDISSSSNPTPSTRKPPTGLLEGLRLIGSRKYVLGITVISTFAEVVSTIMDFQMKVIAKSTPEYKSPQEITKFMGYFGQAANAVSLVLALTGTKFFIRRFGLKLCLLAFPFITGLILCMVYTMPLLWVLFGAMVSMKALGYSLNNPSKEMLYLYTSKDIKFKCKSWIDMFGTRGAKAVGSSVNNMFRYSAEALLSNGSLISGVFVSVWFSVAWFLGNTQRRLEAKQEIVE